MASLLPSLADRLACAVLQVPKRAAPRGRGRCSWGLGCRPAHVIGILSVVRTSLTWHERCRDHQWEGAASFRQRCAEGDRDGDILLLGRVPIGGKADAGWSGPGLGGGDRIAPDDPCACVAPEGITSDDRAGGDAGGGELHILPGG